MNRHVRIERLELDLRGMDPATAEAAVRLLGPALQAELARRPATRTASAGRIDAGRVAAASEPQALAASLATRIAQQTG